MLSVRRAGAGLAAVGCLVLVGCGPDGPKLYPVTGKVLVDGKPAEHATLTFHPVGGGADAPRPRATVKADGSYALTTTTTGDGAPAGDYAVTVEWWLSPAKKYSDPDRPPVNHVAAKYGNPETSKLTARVGEGPTEVPAFELSKK